MKITPIAKLCSVVLIGTLISCNKNTSPAPVMKQIKTKDIHSVAEPNQARVTHLSWKATIDFATQTIHGEATWNIQTAPDADVILLDTKGLNIEKGVGRFDNPT